jgi:hypothetical protein
MADILVPLVPLVVIFIVLLLIFLTVEACALIIPIPQYFAQALCNLLKIDMLITATRTDMWLEQGLKEFKTDIMYKVQRKLGKKVAPLNHMDGTRYDEANSVRWGRTNVKFYYPGKAWPKTITRMAATKLIYDVAVTPISKDGTIGGTKKTTGGLYVKGKLMGKSKDKDKIDPDSVLKHNEYLCLIAQASKYKALRLIRTYASMDSPDKQTASVAGQEILSKIDEFMVIPDGVDKNDRAKLLEIRSQILEELKMVCEFCAPLLVPQTVYALPEFMAAYPDMSTSDQMLDEVDSERTRAAKAQTGGASDTLKFALCMFGAFFMGAGVVILYGMFVK